MSQEAVTVLPRAEQRADVRIVPVADILAREDLLYEHWQEIARNKDVMILNPLADRYDAMERAGVLLCLAAFVDDVMVGYSATVVAPHLHYGGLVYGSNDVLFVQAEHRRGSLGLRLIRDTERHAAQRGARLMLWHAKQGSALDVMLGRLKQYAVQDIIYSRAL
jgi:GNAT superfamily N-acetyltransferase